MVRKIICIVLLILGFMNIYANVVNATGDRKDLLISIEGNQGQNGYYKSVPLVMVQNNRRDARVQYQLRTPKKKIRGQIETYGEEKEVLQGVGTDGKYVLDVWAESVQGKLLSGTERTRTFFVDSSVNKDSIRFRWNSEKRKLEIAGRDNMSGVEKIVYQLGNQKEKTIRGEKIFLTLQSDFRGKVSAYIIDKAGNIGKKKCMTIGISPVKKETQKTKTPTVAKSSIRKDVVVPELLIEGVRDYEITNQDVVFRCNVENSEELKLLSGELTLERVNGHVTRQTLEDLSNPIAFGEEGVYKFQITMWDRQDKQSTHCIQFIIDKTKPVVNQGDTLESMVEEFTSYTCEMTEDGFLLVTDAAGNQTKKSLPKKNLRKKLDIYKGIIGVFVLSLGAICVRLVRRRVRI